MKRMWLWPNLFDQGHIINNEEFLFDTHNLQGCITIYLSFVYKKSPLKLYFKNLFLLLNFLGTYPTGRNVRAVYNLTLNEPPILGNCSITPQSGRTLLTGFNVSCQGFFDPDSPLTYTLYQIQSTGKNLLFHKWSQLWVFSFPYCLYPLIFMQPYTKATPI